MKKLIISLTVLALVSSTFGWGLTEDVVISDTQVYGASSELGAPGTSVDFATLTIESGGSLTASRLYTGLGGADWVQIDDGGTLHLTALVHAGYSEVAPITQDGGLVQVDGYMTLSYGVYNMNGGLLLMNDDDSIPGGTGIFFMPPNNSKTGMFNYSGGTIEIHQEDWSAGGKDILNQAWFDDLSGAASVTYADGVTTIVPEPATMCLLGLGGLLLRRKRK
jgi:hypothetical protein